MHGIHHLVQSLPWLYCQWHRAHLYNIYTTNYTMVSKLFHNVHITLLSCYISAYTRLQANATLNATWYGEFLPKLQGPQDGADLRFTDPQPDTSLHCETTDTTLVHHAVCLFTPQLFQVLTASIHGGMARLIWLGCYILKWLTHLACTNWTRHGEI